MVDLSQVLRHSQVRHCLVHSFIIGGCMIPSASLWGQSVRVPYPHAVVSKCTSSCQPPGLYPFPGTGLLSRSTSFAKTELPLPRVNFFFQTSSLSPPSLFKPILGGLGGAVVGLVAGGFIGAGWFANQENDDSQKGWAAVAGFLIGVALGEPLGLACGVHLGNNRLGNALIDSVVSLAALTAGVGVAAAADEPLVLIGVPVLQLVATIVAERTTAARGQYREVRWCPAPQGYGQPIGNAGPQKRAPAA